MADVAVARRGLRDPRGDRGRVGRAGLLRGGREAVARARRGDGSTLIEAKVIAPDGALVGRPADEVPLRRGARRAIEALDPLPRFRDQLRDAGVLTDEMEAEIAAEIIARRSTTPRTTPRPSQTRRLESAMRWVFAEEWPAETPPAWGFAGHRTAGPTRRRRPRLMALKTFIEAIRETLAEEMRRDPSIIVLGEDVGPKGGVFLATDGL